MNTKKTILAFLASGVWISFSEFVRNELVFKTFWIEKYSNMGLVFPSEPINNALWGMWSFMLSGAIVFLSLRLRSLETIIVTWFMAFSMMWVVLGNLNVFPLGLLLFAIPWSILEVAVASYLSRKILGK